MEECLVGLGDEIYLPYLDDNLVPSQTFEQHLNNLRKVLWRYCHGSFPSFILPLMRN